MPKEPPHRHNGGPLSDEDRRKLWDHIRALEVLDEQEQDIRDDKKARRELAKADGFDVNMIAVVLKRRKAGEGETAAADSIIRIYEEGLRDQGALPLEQTRRNPAPTRRPLEEIARDLHGVDLPPMPERIDPEFREAARRLQETLQRTGATMTIGTGKNAVTLGGDMFDKDPF